MRYPADIDPLFLMSACALLTVAAAAGSMMHDHDDVEATSHHNIITINLVYQLRAPLLLDIYF